MICVRCNSKIGNDEFGLCDKCAESVKKEYYSETILGRIPARRDSDIEFLVGVYREFVREFVKIRQELFNRISTMLSNHCKGCIHRKDCFSEDFDGAVFQDGKCLNYRRGY